MPNNFEKVIPINSRSDNSSIAIPDCELPACALKWTERASLIRPSGPSLSDRFWKVATCGSFIVSFSMADTSTDGIEPTPSPPVSSGTSLVGIFKAQGATWFVGVVLALLGVFSDKIVAAAKFGMNRSDLRAQNYADLSTDLSALVFLSKQITEYLENGWTTREGMSPLIIDYNNAFTKVEEKEYVYRSWLKKYWGDSYLKSLTATFDYIDEFDKVLHSLNDEFELVNITKTKSKVDAERASAAAKKMKSIVTDLGNNVSMLLTRLL